MLAVTIDAGTTNTRVRTWRAGEPLSLAARGVGVRDTTLTGSRDRLRDAVRDAVSEALRSAGAAPGEVALWLATGMIGSNVGLHELPHAVAPAGVAELAAGMAAVELPGIVDAPVWFVPGVRNHPGNVDADECERTDMMRGEEVETVGLLDHLGLAGPALLILPGSHTKLVRVDAHGRIAACATTLAGELLAAIAGGTLLASSLGGRLPEVLDEPMVLRGAETAARVGLNRACFTVRILDQLAGATGNEAGSFLVGAVLGTDLLAAKRSRALPDSRDVAVIVAGTNAMAGAFAALVRADDHFRGPITVVDRDATALAAGRGALRVARARGLI